MKHLKKEVEKFEKEQSSGTYGFTSTSKDNHWMTLNSSQENVPEVGYYRPSYSYIRPKARLNEFLPQKSNHKKLDKSLEKHASCKRFKVNIQKQK